MPAAAVASFTPAIAGISGTWVGASGETWADMGMPYRQRKSSWPGLSRHPRLPADRRGHKTWMPGTRPGMTIVNTIGFEEVTANSYFFAGAILESAGAAASGVAAASGFAAASGCAGVAAAWSIRSTLAVSRSLAT